MARAERITLQEASELSGVSIPTIYRRIRSGELRGAICIDASGKHWELFKSDLPKLTLKRKKRSTEALSAMPVAEDRGWVAAEEKVESALELASADQASADSANSVNSAEGVKLAAESTLLIENEVLKARCADLEDRLKQLREELDSAKDDASYWRGRWEEISLNFEALRKMLEDKNSEDQELIWELRGQVADLQDEHLEDKEQVQLNSFPTAAYQVNEDLPKTTAEITYEPQLTNIDQPLSSPLEVVDPPEEIYPEPDFGDVSSSSLTSADEIKPVATYVELPSERVIQEATTDSQPTSLPTPRNAKFNMRHSKGRSGKRGRKRIPPLR